MDMCDLAPYWISSANMRSIGFIFSVYSFTKAIVSPIVGLSMAKTGRKVMIFSGLILEVNLKILKKFREQPLFALALSTLFKMGK